MKKLIVAAFGVACTAAVHAASVAWSSGTLYTAKDKDGGWSSMSVKNASALVTMKVYLISDAETYATVSAYDQKGIYEWAATQTAKYTGVNKNADTDAFISTVAINDDSLAGSTTYYSIITASYTDADYGDMYMAVAKSVTTAASGTATMANIFGGVAAAGGVRDWQPVPEPTSGLLMLLGMAGLALRRRRA